MAELEQSKSASQSPIEIITDPKEVAGQVPVITVKTNLTNNQTFFLRIKQPQGRATLIAVHL